jgi:hypothetical protein
MGSPKSPNAYSCVDPVDIHPGAAFSHFFTTKLSASERKFRPRRKPPLDTRPGKGFNGTDCFPSGKLN